MKKTIDRVVGFPNGCESVPFIACLVSMLMRAQGLTDEKQSVPCFKKEGDCTLCGDCDRGTTPLTAKHGDLYNLYTAVSGYGFVQIDLSDDGQMRENWWDVASHKLLRAFDDYVAFSLDYAGYEYERLAPPEPEAAMFARIKASVDRDVPVLARIARHDKWALVTGYDDARRAILGLDGSKGYWGPSAMAPAGYEDGLFVAPDWYGKLAEVYVLGGRKTPGVGLSGVFARGVRIMEAMVEKGYYRNSVAFLRDDARFAGLSDDGLLAMRKRICDWIGQPIDIRTMMGSAAGLLRRDAPTGKEAVAYADAHRLCWTMHDVLWIAWKALGQFQKGEPLAWARGLEGKTVRNVVADCAEFVRKHDECILEALRKAF